MTVRVVILAATALLSCAPTPLGTVGKTLLAQAADTRELAKNADSTTIELDALDPSQPPATSEVRIAAGKHVPWRDVRNAVSNMESAGKSVVLLTARRRVMGAFDLYDDVGTSPIEVVVRTDGNACVRLPGVREAKCVQRVDAKHIDRAHLRQLVREAIRVSKLREVVVYVPPDMEWADVVRSVDAARTCCKKTQKPAVKLIDLETRAGRQAPAPTKAPATDAGPPSN